MKITGIKCSTLIGERPYEESLRFKGEGRLGAPIDVYPEFYAKQEAGNVFFTKSERSGYCRKTISLLEIETDEGVTGLATMMGRVEHIRSFASYLLGQDPFATERIFDMLFRLNLSFTPGDVMWAIATVDIALWDLKCKVLAVPLVNLLGGPVRDTVQAYAMARDYSKETPAIRRATREIVDQGFKGIKWYPNHGPLHGREGMRKNAEFVRACREEAGPDIDIMIDCWKTWDVPYTIEMARILGEYRIKWIEEPVFQYKYDQYAEIRHHVRNCWITGGEQLYTLGQFKELLDHKAVDVIQPDPVWCGGITPIMKIIALAQAYDVPTIMHVCHVPLNIHISAALPPAVCPLIEYPVFTGQLADQFFCKNKVYAVNGEVPVPKTPALYDLDEDCIIEKQVVFYEKC